MKKHLSSLAAITAAAALCTTVSATASAADWSQTGYADGDPATVNIISTSADGVVFTQTTDGVAAKARITLDQILADPADVSKVYSGSWTIVYHGLAGSDIQGVGGGCYAATCNSTTYWISPEFNEDGTVTWEDEVTVEDSFKWLLPSQVPTDASQAEFVFMDWANANLVSNNVTIEIKDFKIFDKDGNEIAQKEYSASGAAAEEAPAEEAPAEEAPAAEEATAETEAAPAADTTTPVAATGNTAAASIAAVMAVAGAAALISKRK
ncbi:MAG: hypothetical protein PUI48_09040 [Oscillospiraceae bacterium]|nr:hypothetical protein [Oscillospiraceae bacterium]MDY6207369.1 hypothetical protein [Oscillospiraceae bacterium]